LFIDNVTYKIEKFRTNKTFVLIKLKGIDSIEDAEKLKGKVIYISKCLNQILKPDEYYIDDLYGINVYDDNNIFLGTISNIMHTYAHDVYVIARYNNKSNSNKKTKHNNSEILIPAVKNFILSIDVEHRCMIVHLIEGMLTND
jgi:16S rRNA processing protein RimM